MNRFLEYTQALALDSFLQVLTFEERLQTSQYRAGRTNEVPARVQELQKVKGKASRAHRWVCE